MRSLNENLIERDGDILNLTLKGRAIALEIMQPWQKHFLAETTANPK
jgi:superfamily II helicase